MNIQEQEKLYNLFNQCYKIKINGGGFVDEFVTSMDINTDNNGVNFYEYNSSVYSGRSLAPIGSWLVDVYKRIDNWTEG